MTSLRSTATKCPTRPARGGRRQKNGVSSHHIDINSQLLEAISQEKTSVVRRLISSGADPNVCSTASTRDPALVLACSLTSPDACRVIVSLLLDKGARVDLSNSTGCTALMRTAMIGDAGTCKMLLDAGAMVGVEDCEGNTALSYAAQNGHDEITRMVMEAGKQQGNHIDHRNMRGLTALLLSCKNGHLSTARILVQEGGASPSVRDLDNFMTAAEWMSKSGRYSETELKFLFPVSRKKSYYRRQRQEKGMKILSDYLSKETAANVFSTSKSAQTDSTRPLQKLSISPSPHSEPTSPRSMFDVPSHTATTISIPSPFRKKSILPPVPPHREHLSNPQQSHDFNSDLYRSRYMKKRQLYVAPNRQSGCFHAGALQPIPVELLQRNGGASVQAAEEDRERGGAMRTHSDRGERKMKHKRLPPLK